MSQIIPEALWSCLWWLWSWTSGLVVLNNNYINGHNYSLQDLSGNAIIFFKNYSHFYPQTLFDPYYWTCTQREKEVLCSINIICSSSTIFHWSLKKDCKYCIEKFKEPGLQSKWIRVYLLLNTKICLCHIYKERFPFALNTAKTYSVWGSSKEPPVTSNMAKKCSLDRFVHFEARTTILII